MKKTSRMIAAVVAGNLIVMALRGIAKLVAMIATGQIGFREQSGHGVMQVTPEQFMAMQAQQQGQSYQDAQGREHSRQQVQDMPDSELPPMAFHMDFPDSGDATPPHERLGGDDSQAGEG